jgi:hypothetical protein
VSPFVIAWIVLLCMVIGTLLGMWLNAVLPEHHLNADSRDVVKLGIGMIATMTALILGLMTASAKSAFDGVDAAIKSASVGVVSLDRALAGYGPETQSIRDQLRRVTELRLAASWPDEVSPQKRLEPPEGTPKAEELEREILNLSPQSDAQSFYRTQALAQTGELLQTRLTVFGGTGSSISTIFLVVVVSWLALIFASFGLFAPRNATVAVVLVVCAMSVAASVFLILEMDEPFGGMMKVSSAPIRFALAQLGQ